MGKFLMGILTVFLLAGLGYGAVLVVDALDLMKKDDMLLIGVQKLTGIPKFKETYEVGKKRSLVLQQKETQLVQREERLKTQEKRLAARQKAYDAEFAALEEQKKSWLKDHPPGNAKQTAAAPKPAKPEQTDAALKSFLATVGSMKPEKAAAVIQNLPVETVFAIFNEIRSNQASKLMEKLPPDYLTKLTQLRVERRSSPN